MSEQITNEVIAEFLKTNADALAEDFGYLVIPSDSRLNDEARSKLRKRFVEYTKEVYNV